VPITDACLSIGAALLQQLRAAQAEVAAFVLEEHVQRHHRAPEPIAQALEQADVSVFAACAQRGGSQPRGHDGHREPAEHRRRHMVNITPRIMVEDARLPAWTLLGAGPAPA
jgi:hypothetical protein